MSRKNRKISKPILIFPIEGGCDTVCMKKLYTFWSVVEVNEHVNDTIILRSPRSKDYKGEWYSVTICEDNPQKLIVTCEENTKRDLRELGIIVQHANIFPTIFISQASYSLDE